MPDACETLRKDLVLDEPYTPLAQILFEVRILAPQIAHEPRFFEPKIAMRTKQQYERHTRPLVRTLRSYREQTPYRAPIHSLNAPTDLIHKLGLRRLELAPDSICHL